MPVYTAFRGQHCMADTINSRLSSVCFSTREVAEQYARQPNRVGEIPMLPKVFMAQLTINNPFINQPGDCYLDLEDLLRLLPGMAQTDIPVPLSDQCDYPTYQVWHLLDNSEFIKLLVSRGFDGAIYQGSGCGGGDPEYRVFHPSQVLLLSTTTLD